MIKVFHECRKHSVGLDAQPRIEKNNADTLITFSVQKCPLCEIEAEKEDKILKLNPKKSEKKK